MGYLLPNIPTGLSIVTGLLIVSLTYLLLSPAAADINAIAFMMPQPLGPIGSTPSIPGILLTLILLGVPLGFGIKLLDAPKARLGSGSRFRSLEGQLARRPGVRNPAALSATIGRNKLGKARFQRLAVAGRLRRR